MATKIHSVDGSNKSADEITNLIQKSDVPVVFTNIISDWPAAKWSLDEFTNLFGNIMTTFKLHTRNSYNKKKVKLDSKLSPIIMETDCLFVNATFKQFMAWLNSDSHDLAKLDLGELQKYPSNEYWCYADYKYMAEMFSDNSSVLNAVDWSVFGYPGRNGYNSTIWVSSDEAFTPCHQDTYGTNLVAQIHGFKKWILFPPSEKLHMQPTRIPYEESSVFSQVDVKGLNRKNRFEVELKAGDVLFVPKHWWHYVESTIPSISINTWLEHPCDSHDRVRESLVNYLVYSVKTVEKEPVSHWLNPMQELSPSLDSCLELVAKATRDYCTNNPSLPSEHQHDLNFDNNFLLNSLTDPEVLDKIIDVMVQKLSSKESSADC